ncbi:MAG TPA: FAD-dependent monooxygenase [Pseudonocardiaceae bacterium]|jgi:2-polyprenyl-6-methoxyphenol hydroxylase-like FAD-dependent oxidoreductase|nr:FAD-dependent monooxygenase [Pseudonocardiaceae bacterium]
MASARVLVAGAGIGGLALANGLRRAGFEVEVFEREPSIFARGPGYRINIRPDGGQALLDCLSPKLGKLYLATSNRHSLPRIAGYDDQLNELFVTEIPAPPDPDRAHTSVDRLLLRQILLADLADVVRFGRPVVDATQDEHGVEVRLADGGTATGDVLVAADGTHSALRRRFLPEAEVVDVPTCCVWGKTPVPEDMADWVPDAVRNRFSGVFGRNGGQLMIGLFQPRQPIADAVARYAPRADIRSVDDYLIWVYMSDHETDPDSVGRPIADWHPSVRRLVEMADPSTVYPVGIRIAAPVPAWSPSRITYLGDAIHSMSPAGGSGANTALRDAADLTETLARGSNLRSAIAEYDERLRERGNRAVAESLRYGEQLAGTL